MSHIDRTEQQREMRDEMLEKAQRLRSHMLDADRNGRLTQSVPAPTAAVERSTEDRIAEIDSLIAADPENPNEALHQRRDQLISELSPGAGDGGARAPLPALTVQERADKAAAEGDFELSLSLKTQQLAAKIAERNGHSA